MLLKVNTLKDSIPVESLIRSEDIEEVYQDPYNSDKSIIKFYMDREDMVVEEFFESLSNRYIKMEIQYYYSDEPNDFKDYKKEIKGKR